MEQSATQTNQKTIFDLNTSNQHEGISILHLIVALSI